MLFISTSFTNCLSIVNQECFEWTFPIVIAHKQVQFVVAIFTHCSLFINIFFFGYRFEYWIVVILFVPNLNVVRNCGRVYSTLNTQHWTYQQKCIRWVGDNMTMSHIYLVCKIWAGAWRILNFRLQARSAYVTHFNKEKFFFSVQNFRRKSIICQAYYHIIVQLQNQWNTQTTNILISRQLPTTGIQAITEWSSGFFQSKKYIIGDLTICSNHLCECVKINLLLNGRFANEIVVHIQNWVKFCSESPEHHSFSK